MLKKRRKYPCTVRAGLHKIDNWLGPHQNWQQSAFSKMRQKYRIEAHFQLFIYIILFFYAPVISFLGVETFLAGTLFLW